ncbi:Hypothetical_protein [Hexamita inflata]|uniref:Hypothetical_protein n=1 Tax=Hexamita inflata TaxID=28002 RepID=A0ABP1HE91_9EUKA
MSILVRYQKPVNLSGSKNSMSNQNCYAGKLEFLGKLYVCLQITNSSKKKSIGQNYEQAFNFQSLYGRYILYLYGDILSQKSKRELCKIQYLKNIIMLILPDKALQ